MDIKEETERHRNIANSFFNTDVLEGKINFVRQINAKSYWRLEKEWLKDVKQLKAYIIWKERKEEDWPDEEKAKKDYYQACEQIHRMLTNHSIKAPQSKFKDLKLYLETHYLINGKININNKKLTELIRKKAQRIWETKGETNDIKNWLAAEKYVKMFYENIIPAVLEKNPEENILMVLKAFQFSKALENRYLIINCFEKALAIYFFNPDVIQDIWNKSESKDVPEPSTISTVTLRNLPDNIDVPPECRDQLRFDKVKEQIIFEGVMTHAQKRTLLDKLTEKEYVYAVESLFEQSRLLPHNSSYITGALGKDFASTQSKYRCGLIELPNVDSHK